jgi:Tfp pilus assembly protein PilN
VIKVNLLRNRVQDAAAPGVMQVESGGSDTRDALTKIAFILLFVLALMVWESQTINNLNNERAVVANQVSELETQAQSKATEVEGIKDIAKQAEELKDKLKVLKLLSRLRLREVKTLDFMQSSIPEKVWLKTVIFESDRTKMETGRFQITGNSVSTEDLTDFVKRLEDSAYLQEVIVLKNQEVTQPGKVGSIRDYNFSAEVESRD